MDNTVVGILIALIVNEMVDVSPWLASKLIRAAARLIPEPKLAARLEEEWLGIVDRRPGKLTKLLTALSIVLFGAWKIRAEARAVAGRRKHWTRFRRRFLNRGPEVSWTAAITAIALSVPPMLAAILAPVSIGQRIGLFSFAAGALVQPIVWAFVRQRRGAVAPAAKTAVTFPWSDDRERG